MQSWKENFNVIVSRLARDLYYVSFVTDLLPKLQDHWENQELDGGTRLEGHIVGLRNWRLEETSRIQRRMEASCEGGQGPERAVAPQKVGWMDSYRNFCTHLPTYIT